MKKPVVTSIVLISLVFVTSFHVSAAESNSFAELGLVRQMQVSAGLGAEDDRYHAWAEGEGFVLASPTQGLTTSLRSTGVEVRGSKGAVAMHTLGWGCESVLTPTGGWVGVAMANRVDLASEGITEWYVAGPLGVEQGFTVEAPAIGCEEADEMVIELALGGAAVLSRDRRSLDFPEAALRYRGLVAIDAAGRELPAHLELAGHLLAIRTEVGGAEWPVTVDPLFETAKLLASDGATSDLFGYSVAVSGSTVVVGAYADDDSGSLSGSAYVFVEPVGGWAGTLNEDAKLLASDGAAQDEFGRAVAISGTTIVVGAKSDDDNGSLSGSAYVFTEPVGGWAGTLNEAAKLLASDGAEDDYFGTSIAVSGRTAVIGAVGDDDNGSASGSAYVFTEPVGGWAGVLTEDAKLLASDGAGGDFFGTAVAISAGTAVVGSSSDDDNGGGSGSAYVFVEPVGGWAGVLTEDAKLLASDGAAQDFLGQAVAVSGTTAVVSARHDDDNGSESGSAYVFVEPVGGWAGVLTENAKLLASDGAADDRFGISVAASDTTIVVGADLNDDNGSESGSTYVFTKPAGGWEGTLNEDAKVLAPDGAQDDFFGFSVDISDSAIVVGAPGDNDNGSSSGSAYIGPVPFFTDGFESGDTSSWSSTVQ